MTHSNAQPQVLTDEQWLDLAARHSYRDWGEGYFAAIKAVCMDYAATAALESAAPPADTVPMPQNADQAAGMVALGVAWLREHAPDRLRAAAPSAAEPVACAGCNGSGEGGSTVMDEKVERDALQAIINAAHYGADADALAELAREALATLPAVQPEAETGADLPRPYMLGGFDDEDARIPLFTAEQMRAYRGAMAETSAEKALRDLAADGQSIDHHVVHVYRNVADGFTQVHAPDINDPALVKDMLSDGLRAMDEGEKVSQQ